VRALRYTAFGPVDRALRIEDVAVPVPAPGELLVRVHAAGINPLDWKLVEGQFRWMAKSRPPCGVGAEFAGEVVGWGDGVAGFAADERVAGWLDPFRQPPRAAAEFIALPAAQCVRVPAAVPLDAAAVVPVAGLSARQLIALVDPPPGARVLVHGAAGGIGSFVVPLLRARDVQVVATGSAASQHHLATLAPDLSVDYATPPERWGGPFDAVIDCASRLDASSLATLMPGGGTVAVTLPSFPGLIVDPLLNPLRRIRRRTLRLVPAAAALAELLAMAADGRLPVPLTSTLPLDKAATAYAASRTGHARGKVALRPH
jgi:NADPH:quinone reductase-like Zn-dependent oxidoreductase